MTSPQQPSEWSEPTWQPQQPAQPPPYGQPASEPPAYGQQPSGPPAYGQPTSGTPAYGQPGYGPAGYVQPYTQPMYGQPIYVSRPTNGMAIAALVCSLAGLVVIISAPVGAILGHVARRQIQVSGEQGDGMALAGIIVGWIVTGLYACVCVGYFGLFALLFGIGTVGTQT